MRVRLHLVVELVLAKREHGDEIGARADGELDESLAAFQYKPKRVGLRVEGFGRPADDDGDGAAHAFAVGAASRKDVFARLARHGGEAQGKGVVTVERDTEVGVEGEERVCDAGEELGEAERFRGEGGECAVRDDPVGVVAKDVFSRGREDLGAVEAGWEV